MDRTSILSDTIDYMKELLQKIDNLQHQLEPGPNRLSILDIVKEMKPNEMLVRNSPKVYMPSSNRITNKPADFSVAYGKPRLTSLRCIDFFSSTSRRETMARISRFAAV